MTSEPGEPSSSGAAHPAQEARTSAEEAPSPAGQAPSAPAGPRPGRRSFLRGMAGGVAGGVVAGGAAGAAAGYLSRSTPVDPAAAANEAAVTGRLPAVYAGLDRLQSLLEQERLPNGWWVPVSALPESARQAIDAACGQLLQELAPIASITEPRNTANDF